MSVKKEIEIVINAKGEVTFEMKGVKGSSCFDETKFLEQALGGDAAVLEQGKTSEYYEQGQEGYVSTWGGEGRDE